MSVRLLQHQPFIRLKNMDQTGLLDSVQFLPCQWSAIREEQDFYPLLVGPFLAFMIGMQIYHQRLRKSGVTRLMFQRVGIGTILNILLFGARISLRQELQTRTLWLRRVITEQK